MATVAGFRQAIGGLLRNPEVRESQERQVDHDAGLERCSGSPRHSGLRNAECDRRSLFPLRLRAAQDIDLDSSEDAVEVCGTAMMCIATSCARETLQPEG